MRPKSSRYKALQGLVPASLVVVGDLPRNGKEDSRRYRRISGVTRPDRDSRIHDLNAFSVRVWAQI